VASSIGMSRDQLDRIQTQMKFEAAENFVRHGFRHEAARLFLENLGGATSLIQILRLALRLAIPTTLFQWNREQKRRNAMDKLGTLDDVMKSADNQ
jgi:hypothetical protein